MSEQEAQSSGKNQDQPPKDRQGGSEQENQDQSRNTPLQSGRGDTTIQESVVSQVAGIAAQETEGIRMGGGAQQRASGLLGGVTGGSGKGTTQGVSVEVGKEEAAVDLTLTVEYGRSAPRVADTVRNNVISRIESLLGLRVNEVNVSVTGLFFAGDNQEQSQQRGGEQSGRQGKESSSRVS
ncbi:hypothetical protein BH24ACT16_BH24ACT16_01070 [soil metagenome]|jgi:uncharacterized alkaline shock family protein YloU